MKQLRITILLTALMCMFGTKAIAHDIEVANKDGVTIYYNWIKDKTELAVTYEGDDPRSYDEYFGNVVIPESVDFNGKGYGVTSIGEDAFSCCSNLTSVAIPTCVTSIGDSAFFGCSGLTSVSIPNSVTTIGNSAFCGCENISSVSIPNSVISIGASAFNTCIGLTSVTIPNSVKTIGESAFSFCGGLASVTIPNSVTSIGQSVFKYCSGLTSVTIPNSVTSIGQSAFQNCSGITTVTIPNSVTSIGQSAFGNCSGITSVTIPNSVKTIGESTFDGCSGLTSVTIPNSVTSIGSFTFYNCKSLTSVLIPNSVISLGDYAFCGCGSLTSVSFPNSVTSIGSSSFMNCSSLTSVSIPNSVASIGSSAFSNCSSLSSVSIPNSVIKIGSHAFYGCANLTRVYCYSEEAPDIDTNAFNSSTYIFVSESALPSYQTSLAWKNYKISIKEIEPIEVDGIYYYIGAIDPIAEVTSSPNKYSDLQKIVIPESFTYDNKEYIVKHIGDYTFQNCSDLTLVSIPNSVTKIDSYAFSDCDKLARVYCCPEEAPDIDLYAFNTSTNIFVSESALPSYLASSSWKKYKLSTKEIEPIEVDDIYYYLYALNPIAEVTSSPNNYSDIPKIVIPESITYENKEYAVNYIGNSAFSGCSDLTSVSIPNSVRTIGDDAFYNCSSLTSVTIPNSVTSIGDCAFDGCISLTSVTIPNSVTSIGSSTFRYCSSLTSITIPNSVTTIGDYSFYGCSSLTSVSIPNNVTSIGPSTFQSCSSLTSVSIPNSVTSIGYSAFYDCSSLKSIVIPSSVTSIGSSAFSYCRELEAVHITDVAAWCNIVFENEYSNPIILANHIFLNKEELKELIIPDNITTINNYAFRNCYSIRSLSIGNGVNSIGISAFHGCDSITSVTIPNNVNAIGESAFYSCENLKSVTIPNSIVSISENAFAYCSGMTSLILPEGLSIIKKQAFTGCTSLAGVTIPASVEFIYQEAFAYCSNLTYINPLSETPPFLYDNSFSDYNVPVIVPSESVEAYKNAQGWKNFYNINDVTYYKLVYKVDDAEYKTYNLEIGTVITPEEEPTREGYKFSGWSDIPGSMPAEDVTVTGTFTINKYKLTYQVDGEEYKSDEIEYGLRITPEEEPTKEGYTFSGWSEIPETMPAHDVTVTGSFSKIDKGKETINIGGKGKTTLTSSKALDFSSFEDLKAYVATGYESDGTIWLTRIMQVPANTPILIKGEADKAYEVPVLDNYVAYFENMFLGSADEDLVICTTTEDGKYKNFYMAGGQFKPASASQPIKAGKCYLQVPANFKVAVAGTDQPFKIADSGKSSYAPPVDIDLTNAEYGLKAYAATGYDPANSTIWLTRINRIQAGEGVILKGEPGKTYLLPAAEVQAYYGNMFEGNIGETITINETSDDGEWTNYYLASGSFKKVNGTRNIPSQKSYLQLPTYLLVSSARGKNTAGIDEWFMEELETETMLLGSIGGDDDGTTRIDAIANDNAQLDVYYNLQGQRVDNPRKGLYIKNGVKVVIK